MARALSNILEVIDRSIFSVINAKLVEEGYSVDRTIDGVLTTESLWKIEEATIQAQKGFVVELFGASSNRDKEELKSPRISYIPERLTPGSIGNSPGYRYNFDSKNNIYEKLTDPNQTSDYQFKIHLVANNAMEFRLLHSVIAATIPHKEYIPLYNDPTQNFMVEQYGYQDNPEFKKGLLEGFYMYRVIDIYEYLPKVHDDAISPISETTLTVGEASSNTRTVNSVGNLESELETILVG